MFELMLALEKVRDMNQVKVRAKIKFMEWIGGRVKPKCMFRAKCRAWVLVLGTFKGVVPCIPGENQMCPLFNLLYSNIVGHSRLHSEQTVSAVLDRGSASSRKR